MFTDSLHHMSVPGLFAGQKITTESKVGAGWVAIEKATADSGRVVGTRARMSRDFSHTPGFVRLGHATFHLAVSRCANSSWNIITAHRNMGLCASSLNSNGEEICTTPNTERQRAS